MFVFVTKRAIPAANTGSGRALRPCAAFCKITDGFRTKWVPAFMPVSAPSSPPRRRAIGAREAIRLALAGTPLATAP